MKSIIKRNGTTVAYDRNKISKAIAKAFISVNSQASTEQLEDYLNQIEAKLSDQESCGVELIQDTVEQVLMKNDQYAVAKSYIL